MVAMKLNRVNLLELQQMNLACSGCGSSVNVDIAKVKKRLISCPVCGASFSDNAVEAMALLQKAYSLATAGEEKGISFDVIVE